jgi:ribosome biogenesis GTPase A
VLEGARGQGERVVVAAAAAAAAAASLSAPPSPQCKAQYEEEKKAFEAAAAEAERAAPDPQTLLAEAAREAEAEAEAEGLDEEQRLALLIKKMRVKRQRPQPPHIVVGVIGHPNAGKSCLINALCGAHRVSVSETPGHTKHLQTVTLSPFVHLCDCPGIVFPAVDMPRPLQVLCGIFPLAQTRDPYSAVKFLAERVPIERIFRLVPVKL